MEEKKFMNSAIKNTPLKSMPVHESEITRTMLYIWEFGSLLDLAQLRAFSEHRGKTVR